MIEEMIIELKIIRGAIYLKTLSRELEEKYFIYDLSIPSNTMAAHIGNILLSRLKIPNDSGERASPNFKVAINEHSIANAITTKVLLM